MARKEIDLDLSSKYSPIAVKVILPILSIAIASTGVVCSDPVVKSFVKQHSGELVEGVLVKDEDTLKFVPKDKDWEPVTVSGLVAGGPKVEEIQAGIAVPIKAAVTLSPGGNSVKIEGNSQAAVEWLAKRPDRLRRVDAQPEAKESLSEISDKVKAYNAEFASSVGTVDPARNEKLAEIKTQIESKVGETLLQAGPGSEVDSTTVLELATLMYKTDFHEKGEYRGAGSTSPAFYREILKYSQAVAKIETSSQTGTGFLIGTNVLVTCKHVVQGARDDQIKVFFFPDDGGAMRYKAELIGGNEAFVSSNLKGVRESGIAPSVDLAILRISGTDQSKTGDGLDYLAGRQIAPIRLSDYDVSLQENIFGFGFPSKTPLMPTPASEQGGLALLDPGVVQFPYRVSQADLNLVVSTAVKSIVYTLIKNPAPGALVDIKSILPDSQREISGAIAEQLTLLREFYGKPGTSAGTSYYWNAVRSDIDGLKTYRPTVGLKASIYGGDSGAPVFSKSLLDRKAIGMIYGGAEDRPRIYEMATPNAHETAIPAGEIIKYIRAHHADLVNNGTIKLD